jgi:condensin complex subunit 2
MKMATDNKINATNSWNFALIDYFHDMSLLKEGDGVNFQKASCTLDGCVKIYTNRVDSVATETGKLLSGLADSNNAKKKDKDGEDADESDEEELDEDGNVKKKPKKKVWIVTSFKKFKLIVARPSVRQKRRLHLRSIHFN